MLDVQLECVKKINYSLVHNGVKIIDSIRFINNSDEVFKDLKVKVRFEPEIASEFIFGVSYIDRNQSIIESKIENTINFDFLYSLNESFKANIIVEVYFQEEKISGATQEIEVLTFDQWDGSNVATQFLASFVLPNDTSVKQILKSAETYLSNDGVIRTFNGYLANDKDLILKEIGSIYYALLDLGISYALPKPSFEINGQKVRLPGEIVSSKFATCLDSTLLLSAVLELAGINSLLILIDHHAYLGAWLNGENYPSVLIEDKAYIENKVNSNEMVLIETTLLTSKANVKFEEALLAGKHNLNKKTNLFFAIDLRSARASGIKPLPIVTDENGKYKIEEKTEESNKTVDLNYHLEEIKILDEKINKDRFDVWEKKLLDLSNRNKLVSFIPGAQHYQLFTYDIFSFFNILIHRNLNIYSEKAEIYKELIDKIYDVKFPQNKSIFDNDLENQRVRLLVPEKRIVNTLRTLQANAKSSIEESGSNTLFVTLGTLSYVDKGKTRYAPIVLIPVDIIKNSTGRTYSLSFRDDEIIINNTLFEYLKVNFDFESDELRKIPYNETTDTYDLKSYLNTLRNKITGISGWTLSETAFIGIFSFTRFIMWNDLRNRKDDLLKNDIVRSLVDNSIPFKNKVQPINANDLDSIIAPTKYAIPLMADSSQTEAIVDASRGLSFVLNGPPGTGKSQTITNMIINSLYNKKTVLFVAQKMAALEVVKRRLDETGLGMFCLELHSNKAQKADVLNQIKKIIEVGKLKKPEDYDLICAKLLDKRNELNNDIKKLHKESKNGFDLYENIITYEEFKDDFKDEKLVGIDYEKLKKDDYIETLNEIERFLKYKNDIGVEYIKIFNLIKLNTYSISLRNDLKDTLEQYLISLFNFKTLIQDVREFSKADFKLTHENLIKLTKLFNFYNENKDKIYINYVLNNDETLKAQLYKFIEKMPLVSNLYSIYTKSFNEKFINLDFDNLLFRYDRALNLGYFAKNKEIKNILKDVRAYSKNPKMIDKSNLKDLLSRFNEFKIHFEKYNNLKDNLTLLFGDDFKGYDTDCIQVIDNIMISNEFSVLFNDFESSNKIELLNFIFNNAKDKFIATSNNNFTIENRLKDNYSLDVKEDLSVEFFNSMTESIKKIISNIEKLKEYILFNEEKSKLSLFNVGNLIELSLENKIKDSDLINFYKKEVNYNLAMLRINTDSDLNLFSGSKENDIIDSYRKIIKEYNEVTIKEVAARLSKSTSTFFKRENSKLSSEFVILNKAISNNGRGISLRNLFDSIPNILHMLCPCFLMSPLSVSQYLDPKNIPFDIVIFDEASQITTSDAIGAIARGKSAIIVGDEKQLPPTSFFQANTSDEDDFFIEDGDSVLMDCLNISMPKKYLSWHYRSKDESLIAFSNSQYYDNRLLTFPSPSSINGAISYHYVMDGVYENRRNKKEAEEIVKEIIRRLKDPILSTKSIGVVTFSISQQSLIQEKLQEAFRKDPSLENALMEQKEEIFIKNLENVQGDERDVIIFSICYGPSKDGRVSLNFGPLSTSGGEKRLNVAVSRAREEMVVFTSLRSEMIDLSRAQNLGSKGLKQFLEYAQKGKRFILIKNGEQKEYVEGIEKYIARDLEKRGYETHINVGTSDFRVDIGVVDPLDNNKYVLGVLCDSKSYINSKTAKDRNVIQKAVLNRLGWRVIRIWSLDYFDSPNYVIDKIVEAIRNCDFDKDNDVPSIPKINFIKDDSTLHLNHSVPYIKTSYIKRIDDPSMFEENKEITKNVASFFIKNEAPISKKILCKRILETFGISKNSAKTNKIFFEVLNGFKETLTGDIVFYWLDELQYLSLKNYRIGNENRSFNDIPKEEILIAIRDIMSKELSLTLDELLKEIINAFGFYKISDNIKHTALYGIEYALEKKVIREEEGVYYYLAQSKVER